MEYSDVVTTLLSGFALGFIAGHWLKKQDLRLEYERGRLDGSTKFGPTSRPPGSTQYAPALANLPEVRRLVVTQALDDLFTKQYFSICQLDSVMAVLNASKHSEAYKLLRALHCVDYGVMRPELRESIPQLVNECLRPPLVVDCSATSVAIDGVVV